MKPALHWMALRWSIWAVLFFTSKAKDEECAPEIQVRRNTVYETFPGQQLRIDCPVEFCNNSPPTVDWYKLEETVLHLNVNNNNHIIMGWEKSGLFKGISYLTFQNIISSDSGIYRCASGGSVSHNINITVNEATDAGNNTHTTISNETTDKKSTTKKPDFMVYVYCAAGIGSFVFIVIILSVICMLGCKRKSKKKKPTENQYMEIPLAEQGTPNATGLQHSPRGSPNPLPSRRTSERKPTAPPVEPRIPRDNVQLYGQVVQDRKRQRNATQAGEANSNVVYASLNHGPAPREAARPHRQIEETEYAAIRLP